MVHYNNGLISCGIKKSNELCYQRHDTGFPRENHHLPPATHPQDPCPHAINVMTTNTVKNVYQLSQIKDAMQFLHVGLFSSAKQTLLKAVSFGFLSAWPLITSKNVSKHLIETIASHQGHLKRVRNHTKSAQRR